MSSVKMTYGGASHCFSLTYLSLTVPLVSDAFAKTNMSTLHRCPGVWATWCTWWTCPSPPPHCSPLLKSQRTAHQRLVPLWTATARRWWRVQGTLISSSPPSTYTIQKTIPLHRPAVRQPDQNWSPGPHRALICAWSSSALPDCHSHGFVYIFIKCIEDTFFF